MKLKIRKQEFEVNETDIVMYNGACYQLLTQMSGYGWDSYYPIIAKTKAEKMIKDNILILKNEKQDGGMLLKYYQFVKDGQCTSKYKCEMREE